MNHQEPIHTTWSLEQNLLYLIMMIISLALLVNSVLYLVRRIRSRPSSEAGNTFRWFTVLVLAATTLVFIPIYLQAYSFGDPFPILRPILLAVHRAMQVFVLNCDFDFVRNSIQGMNGALHVLLSSYMAVLYVAAPAVFTFTIFLSIFRDAFTGILFRLFRESPLYIFSCLNENSAAMAMSILQSEPTDQKDKQKKRLIVFCDVPQDGERREKLIALVPVLTSKHALVIFTAKTVDKLNLTRFHNEITFFLMDESDAKNVQDASALSKALLKQAEEKQAALSSAKQAQTEKKQTKQSTPQQEPPVPGILVYASSPASIPLIEAMTHSKKDGKDKASGVFVPDTTIHQIMKIIDDACSKDQYIEQVKKIIDDACSTDGGKETDQAMPDSPIEQIRKMIDDAHSADGSEAKSKDPSDSLIRDIKKTIDSACSADGSEETNQAKPDSPIEQIKTIIDSACSLEVNQANIIHAIQNELQAQPLPFSQPVSIMRIDVKKQMAIRIIQDFLNSEAYQTSMNELKSVTITLLGLGGIGKEILENLLWMCQQYEHKLIVNVFDTTGPELGDDPDAAHNPLYDRLAYEWPELISTNRKWQQKPGSHPDTEAEYDIRFFFGMDCFSNRFRELFENAPDVNQRLQQSTVVICSLGDDDKNLEAALMMRQLFKGKTGDRQPDIYAVVYDDQQSDCISDQGQLTHYYKDTPYGIKTVGSMREQYDFTGIEAMAEIEKTALVHHISWSHTRMETDKKPSSATNDEDKPTALKTALNLYIHYEYYRQSSVAKAIHRTYLEDHRIYPWDVALLQDKKRHDYNDLKCRCTFCQFRITEHMRWNTYMRVKGYSYGRKRNDMAKIHDCLRPWTALPDDQRIYD